MAAAEENQGKKATYTIIFSKRFRRDLKRIDRSRRYDLRKLWTIVSLLAAGQELPPSNRDHKLTGDLEGRAECHIESDWILIYRRDRTRLILILLRTGTHSQLFNA